MSLVHLHCYSCSVLQRVESVAAFSSYSEFQSLSPVQQPVFYNVLQCAAVCCCVVRRTAVCCRVPRLTKQRAVQIKF